MLKYSIVICTYNPRKDYLLRTLEGLRLQTLPLEEWEFLLIDNNSKIPVEGQFDLSWHPNARVVVEPKQGLTAARVCSISEAKGDLLIFVDDDNILEPSYLENAVRLIAEFPDLGCYGASRLIPEFEVEPDSFLKNYTGYLAVREFAPTKVSSVPFERGSTPWGAGMCMKASVGREFCRLVEGDTSLKGLGRNGDLLLSGEDLLFSWVACEEGFRIGVFEELTLVHLIDKKRISKNYLVRIAAGQAYSSTALRLALGVSQSSDIKGLGFVSLLKALLWKNPAEIIAAWPFVTARWKARRLAASQKLVDREKEFSTSD